jgi:dTDP-4-dehydrorhamnose reductase
VTQAVLVLGAGGQLGRALQAALGERAVARRHAELDITDAAAVAAALDALRPAAVVNAAAYTAVDRAESDAAAAQALNADAPGALAAACAARGVGLVHVSTDYVFDGEKSGAYREDDLPNPQGVYGASKAAGEAAVRAAHPGALIVRTSWVFSDHPPNFVLTMLRLARERGALRVVADQFGRPTHAGDLARGLIALLDAGAAGGIYHYAGSGATSWFGLATAFIEAAAAAGLCAAVPIEPIRTEAYPTPAKRPPRSVLDTTKVEELGITPRPWIHGVRAVVQALRERAA